jgi:hypothetical protein
VDARYRTIVVLWAAILMSVLSFLLFINLTPVEPVGNTRLSLALNTAGIVPVALSFLLKSKIVQQAIDQRRMDLVQVAYTVAMALCEVSGLLGLMDHYLTGSSYYPLGFGIALLGMLLHFPQKKYVVAASGQEF